MGTISPPSFVTATLPGFASKLFIEFGFCGFCAQTGCFGVASYTQTGDHTVSVNANHCFYSAAKAAGFCCQNVAAVVSLVNSSDCACQFCICQLFKAGCFRHNCFHGFVQCFFILQCDGFFCYFRNHTQASRSNCGNKQKHNCGFYNFFCVHAFSPPSLWAVHRRS